MNGRRDLASILEDIASELRRANDLAEGGEKGSGADGLTPAAGRIRRGRPVLAETARGGAKNVLNTLCINS